MTAPFEATPDGHPRRETAEQLESDEPPEQADHPDAATRQAALQDIRAD